MVKLIKIPNDNKKNFENIEKVIEFTCMWNFEFHSRVAFNTLRPVRMNAVISTH